MKAARTRIAARSQRGAFGASLALHGALAAAAILPIMQQEPIRPAPPDGLEVVWAAPAALPGPMVAPEMASEHPLATEAAEAQPLAAEPPSVPDAAETLPSTPEQPFASPAEHPAAPAEPAMAETAAEAPTETPPPLPQPEPAAEAAPPEPARSIRSEPETAAAPPREVPAQRATMSPPSPPRPAARERPPSRPPAPRTRTASPQPLLNASGAASGAEAPVQAAARLAPAAPEGPVLITAPRYRRPPAPPVYPPRAVEFGLTGTVLVRARVGPDGTTAETRLWRSSGHALLDAAAIAAVRRWEFEAASVDGRRVEAWVEVPVHFRLN